jgi:Ca2+/Na+ antiporter
MFPSFSSALQTSFCLLSLGANKIRIISNTFGIAVVLACQTATTVLFTCIVTSSYGILQTLRLLYTQNKYIYQTHELFSIYMRSRVVYLLFAMTVQLATAAGESASYKQTFITINTIYCYFYYYYYAVSRNEQVQQIAER